MLMLWWMEQELHVLAQKIRGRGEVGSIFGDAKPAK